MARDSAPVRAAAERRRAGHQEILGETMAKFEFFQHGWHPYSRFLDVDKIDLVLRRRLDSQVQYREVQVKFGKLYQCGSKWERKLFSVSFWRFFSEKVLTALTERPDVYLALSFHRTMDSRATCLYTGVGVRACCPAGGSRQ